MKIGEHGKWTTNGNTRSRYYISRTNRIAIEVQEKVNGVWKHKRNVYP